jgi:hypothetical protein
MYGARWDIAMRNFEAHYVQRGQIKTAAQNQNPTKKPDADAHSQASGVPTGLYEIPGINA